ncbi:MAG: hypothetical protein CR991_07520 [Proteobacteria bacterium]|nr:MAG: hypothetical protein CR991_07520 [Pseudomonadota bacterium]
MNPKTEQPASNDLPWWQAKPLDRMTTEEWEALCDGCARCCMNKLQDEQDSTVYYTDIACDLLEQGTCHCRAYECRAELMPDCVQLSPHNLEALYWMPPSCAYRLLHEGKDLPAWHYLLSDSRETVHTAKQSALGRFVYSNQVHEEEWESRVVEWPLQWKA